MSSKDHYESLLAARYSWMRGAPEPIVEAELATLLRLGLVEAEGEQTAVDLGAGTGIHCRVLLRLAYRIVAVDNSPTILGTLADLPVTKVEADLATYDPEDARVVV